MGKPKKSNTEEPSVTTSRLGQLEEDMYGNEKRKIPGVINDLSHLKRMMRFALIGIAVILSNLLGLWRVSDPIDLAGVLTPPTVVDALPSLEPDPQIGAQPEVASSEASSLQRASRPFIEISPDLEEWISRYLINPALLLGLP